MVADAKNFLEDGLVAADSVATNDEQLFVNLRAKSWQEFIGQEQIKLSLSIAISAAKERGDVIDHVLLYGPPGLGKTTLSHLIAKEMSSSLVATSGTAIAKSGDLAAILTNLNQGDVLFIDEIHRLPKNIEELLYSAMEDFVLDIVLGKGPSARTVRLDIPKFTLVGATTRFGSLAGPFRDRFGLVHRLEHYQVPTMATILKQAATKLEIELSDDTSVIVAQRSRGTPRIGLQLLKRVRDYAQVKNAGILSPETVGAALTLVAIDELGLTDSDRSYLQAIVSKHSGGPVGLTTLAALLHEDPGTIEDVLEPYLLQIGFLKRTPKGRVTTPAAEQHLTRTLY